MRSMTRSDYFSVQYYQYAGRYGTRRSRHRDRFHITIKFHEADGKFVSFHYRRNGRRRVAWLYQSGRKYVSKRDPNAHGPIVYHGTQQ